MKPTFSWGACAVSILLAGSAQASGNWETISVELDKYDVAIGSELKSIWPSCQLDLNTHELQPYSFHFKAGKTDRLLIYLNGGGGCWDSNTCVASLSSSLPTWVPSVAVANDPAQMGGILKLDEYNPYADWNILFISYCTGDVHVGSAVTFYDSVPIYHRGFDNFLYALDWLRGEHPEIDPKKILVAGSSAGAYGAGLNYPWVREFYPYADKVFLLGDSGFGVLDHFKWNDVFADTSAFSNAVFGEESVWGLLETVHPDLAAVPEEAVDSPDNFFPKVYEQLATVYPHEKFAQYTTAYDVVQVLFWDIMLNPEPTEPWGTGLFYPPLVSAWNIYMNLTDIWLQSFFPENYRSYIDSGCSHTILRSDDDFYASSLPPFYGNQEVAFLEWLTAMTGDGKEKDWQNLSCDSSDCEYPDVMQIQTCLEQALPTQ